METIEEYLTALTMFDITLNQRSLWDLRDIANTQ